MRRFAQLCAGSPRTGACKRRFAKLCAGSSYYAPVRELLVYAKFMRRFALYAGSSIYAPVRGFMRRFVNLCAGSSIDALARTCYASVRLVCWLVRHLILHSTDAFLNRFLILRLEQPEMIFLSKKLIS